MSYGKIEYLLNPYMIWSLNILSQAQKKPFLKHHHCVYMYVFVISNINIYSVAS